MKIARCLAAWVLGLSLIAATAWAAPSSSPAVGTVARKVLALVDLREEERIRLTRVHSLAEMPLNHLGLDVEYWDVAKGLPDIGGRHDLRGIITWFAGEPFTDPRAYITWLLAAMDRGLKVAVMGQPGIRGASDGVQTPMALVNRFYGRFGVRDDDGYTDLTYNSVPVVADDMIGFERALDGVIPGYPLLRPVDPRITSHLVLRRGGNPETDSHLVVTGPAGGFSTEGFTRYYDPEFIRKSWIIDPFLFFRAVFDTDAVPKPDVNTLSNRRLYFSHIDGDGWRNVTEVQPFAKSRALSSTVVRKVLIEPYPDLPVAVAPIVGDLDPSMAGTPESKEEARQVFALPQVEASSHTWSHPFFWGFFEDYTPDKEAVFHAAGGVRRSGADMLAGLLGRKTTYQVDGGGEGGEQNTDIGRYKVPRAFLQTPFDLRQEIAGSFDYMDTLLPPGKPRVRLLQWSGDTQPGEAAIAMVRQAGGVNMNGGDARFDPEYPSYTAVCSIGKPVGKERQIYSGESNENTYTDLWTNRFFGFQNLAHTLLNTETPIRVRPFNIYYHSYSGQKLASLNAVQRNLDLARRSELTPVAASRYVDVANGFYTTRFVADGRQRWRVLDRGALQTVRFDRASMTAVDFARSVGIIGQRHYQGSLYIALDPAVAEPVVALAETDRADIPPPAARPYLVQGRWLLSHLSVQGQGWRVEAQGYGSGDMEWFVPWAGQYRITARRGDAVLWTGIASVAPEGQRLKLDIAADAIQPLTLDIQPRAAGGG